MNTETTITYKLDNGLDKQTALKNIATDILAKLKTKFGNEYVVTANDIAELDKDWAHDIKVRKGNKIGAEVSFKWEKTNADIVTLEVENSSKLGSKITYITLFVFLMAGAYMGYNDITPLAFLPGQKIAAGLGGLIMLIPGLIVVSILKSILMKNEKEENKTLVNEVRQVIQN